MYRAVGNEAAVLGDQRAYYAEDEADGDGGGAEAEEVASDGECPRALEVFSIRVLLCLGSICDNFTESLVKDDGDGIVEEALSENDREQLRLLLLVYQGHSRDDIRTAQYRAHVERRGRVEGPGLGLLRLRIILLQELGGVSDFENDEHHDCVEDEREESAHESKLGDVCHVGEEILPLHVVASREDDQRQQYEEEQVVVPLKELSSWIDLDRYY